jgi:anti-sigma regulatory factor (Ser/Thr protein kinase)
VEVTNLLGETARIIVDDPSKVGEARRTAVRLTERLGFDQSRQGTAALIVTEAASNLIKHAGLGEVIVQGMDHGPAGESLEVLALDSGPGMRDVGQCSADGYSTAGSQGTGLGAIRRLADGFAVFSSPGLGTVLRARLDRLPPGRADGDAGIALGVVGIPAPGEEVCGDAWATTERDGRRFVLLVDGLGHGEQAARAAEEAVRVFRAHEAQEPAHIVESIHASLRSTRGAALAIARLDRDERQIHYAGVGNISGVIRDWRTGARTSMISQSGTVGYAIRKVQTYQYAWNDDSLLLMHSDGLATHWDLDRFPGLLQMHPSLIAGVLYRDYRRGRDDVTVLTAREARTGDS